MKAPGTDFAQVFDMKNTLPRKDDQTVIVMLAILLSALGLWVIGCGGGGASSGTPTTPSGSSSDNIAATITITASGVSDPTPRIASGQRVRFVNSDTRVHEMLSTPHLAHTDCPALNSVGTLPPGQSGVSGPLTGPRGCGFHDHLNPDDNQFRGQVLVGLATTDPVPDPTYLRH
jgi:hypothetical protein